MMYVGSPLSLELMRAYRTPDTVIDMPASMANPDGPWVVRQQPLGGDRGGPGMTNTTKVLLAAGGVAVVGTAAFVLLRGRRSASFRGLPSKPWHQQWWSEQRPIRQKQAIEKWYAEAGRGVMSDVADLVNAYGGEPEAGKALGRGLYQQHRTLQSNFFRALPDMFGEYVRQADQFGTDARNEAAVALARKLVECSKSEPLPFI
jgi:hypothetical protein